MNNHSDRAEDEFIEDVFLQDDLCPTIAEHATQCNALFHKYMAMPEIVPDPTIIDDQLARFTLWASNMDVYGPLNVSLDYRLRFSPTVVDIIHQLLDVIADTLSSLKPIEDPLPRTRISSNKRRRTSVHGDSGIARRADDDASDSDSDVDQAEENISKITHTVDGTVTRLFRLSNAVRKSAKANRARKIERYRDDEEANRAIDELRTYTDCYIAFRFPSAPVLLRSALVEANALRLRRLFYQRTHRRRIDMSILSPEATLKNVQLPKMRETSPAAVRFAMDVLRKPATTKTTIGSPHAGSPRAPAPVTNATTARQTNVGVFYAKSTTEVPRAKSILVNNKLSFPSLPPTPECPYCGVIIEFKNSSKTMLWHNHVIGDLEPFICVFEPCWLEASQHGSGPPTFETSKAWINHMQNAHGHIWECRAPSHGPKIFSEEKEFQDHSIHEHGVPESHVGTLSSAARRPVHQRVLECPFGDDFQQPPEQQQVSDSSLSATGGSGSGSGVFSSEALQSHVAAHVKEIALLALQKLPNDGDEDADKNVASDLVSEDQVGPGEKKTRESMWSVLDDDEDLEYPDDDVAAADRDLGDDGEDIAAPFTVLDLKDDFTASIPARDLDDKTDLGTTQLHRAIQQGDLDLVQSLLNEGADISSRDENGRTVFHYACMAKSLRPKFIDGLLQAARDRYAFPAALINAGDDNGQTALHYAAERDSSEEILILLRNGANLDITDNYGFSPCLWAVVAGKIQATWALLHSRASVHAPSADGKSALAWAAVLGWDTIARFLLDFGADVSNIQNPQMRPLKEAACSGDLFTARLLLDHGADPNVRDRDGWSPIHWAAEQGHQEIVRLLLNRGANINAISSYGTSPLHCAANGGSVPVVTLLLEEGADPLKITCHGWTALHHAVYNGHSDVVQRLLDDDRIRPHASQQDNHGWSVLHLAVHSRDLATVNILVGSSVIAEPQALVDESGLTAEEWLDRMPTSSLYKARSNLAFGKSRCCRAVTGLRQAVVTGSLPLVRLFCRSGYYRVDGADSGQRTALYYAAKKRMLPIMDLLLENGADPNVLPTGRGTWEEFISDADVLQRLRSAGYRKRNIDPVVDGQIRLALRAQRQPSVLRRSVRFSIDESSSAIPDRSPFTMEGRSIAVADESSVMESRPGIMEHRSTTMESRSFSHPSAPSAPLSPITSVSSIPTHPPAPGNQPTDHKRKAKSGRKGSFWKRLLR